MNIYYRIHLWLQGNPYYTPIDLWGSRMSPTGFSEILDEKNLHGHSWTVSWLQYGFEFPAVLVGCFPSSFANLISMQLFLYQMVGGGGYWNCTWAVIGYFAYLLFIHTVSEPAWYCVGARSNVCGAWILLSFWSIESYISFMFWWTLLAALTVFLLKNQKTPPQKLAGNVYLLLFNL